MGPNNTAIDTPKRGHKKPLIFAIILAVLMTIIIGGQSSKVYADIIAGDGKDSANATFKGCNQAQRWQNVAECSNKHGGASWHVFSVNNTPLHDENKPNSDARPILTASLWSSSKYNKMISGINQCKEKGSKYYVAFVYDGWYGSGSNWSKKSLIFYGPLSWREYEQGNGHGSYHTPIYHKKGTHYTAAQVQTGLKKGTNMNGWRIKGEGPTNSYKRASKANWKSKQAAILWSNWSGKKVSNVPKGTGWFCLTANNVTLKATAVKENGDVLKKNFDSSSGPAPHKGTVGGSKLPTFTNYYFAGYWRDSKKGKKTKSGKTYTKTISENTTVYAVYKKCTKKKCPNDCGKGSGSSSYTTTKIRNGGVDKYSSWTKSTIYAKPGDDIDWLHCYYSGVQKKYGKTTTAWNVDAGHPNKNTKNNNKKIQKWLTWENYWWIDSVNVGYWWQSKNYKKGEDPTVRKHEHDDYIVGLGQVTQTLTETSHTSFPSSVSIDNQGTHSWTCKCDSNGNNCKTCHHKNDYYYTTWAANASDSASVIVPYNYENTAEVTNEDYEEVVYAGETKTINFNAITIPRINALTTNGEEDDYATNVPFAQTRIEVCYSDLKGISQGCAYTTPVSIGPLNSPLTYDKLEEGSSVARSTDVSIPDAPAGSEVCVSAQIYPATSGDPANTSNIYGDGQWASSDPVCFLVAKRPSLQVWGGNVYSFGGIYTSTADKGHLAGTAYSTANVGAYGHHLFGSWAELGILASGGVSGFASGAATGYAGSTNFAARASWPGSNPSSSPGGTSQTTFCYRSRLTFANSPCSSLGQIGTTINTVKAKSDKSFILDVLAKSTDSSELYQYYSGSTDLQAERLTTGGIVKVIRADGDIHIRGDLTYGGNYKMLSDLPKLVIYSKQNIKINCSVSRIDALLIAEGTVTTCVDDDGNIIDAVDEANDARLSNQLIINGAIIANNLVPNRTYGAATGVNSVTPAEIINFDPTFYRFGSGTEGTTNDTTGRLDITYTRELAPRQ